MPKGADIDSVLDAVVDAMGGSRREEQVTMARKIGEALDQGEHLLVQAGTGTGKSLGYLIPAMMWAVEEEKPVIVSTATLALQKQITAHDAPRVCEELAEKYQRKPIVRVLKGWNNYVCMRKAMGGYPEEDTLMSRAEGEYGLTARGEEVVRARRWAMNTQTGDRDDLSPGVDGRVWAQLSISKPECIGDRCPMKSSCFPRRARKEAMEADIIVTNHAMLALQATGTAVLPEAHAYIIDEAHELVDRVTSQLTATISPYLLHSLIRLVRREKINCVDLESSSDSLSDILDDLPEGRLVELPAELYDALVNLRGSCQKVGDDIAHMRPNDDEKAAAKKVASARAADLIRTIDTCLSVQGAEGELVMWIDKNDEGSSSLAVAPLDVSEALAASLFEENPVILTSATLALGGNFEHIARQVGFSLPSQGQWQGLNLPNPFHPKKQAICYIASDLPEPNQEGYSDTAFEYILRLIEASGGGALGLFTSRKAAQRAADYVRDKVDFPVLLQGDSHLPELISHYKDDESA
ncbi:MAG: ATP-dependent DNA helicase, partial [Actinomycetaceae bacterium]|nr:ATP-dependent DNA helicase [Actinomycetaceae bacterium]